MSQYLPTLLDQVAQTCRTSDDPEFKSLSDEIDRVPREKPEKASLECSSKVLLFTLLYGLGSLELSLFPLPAANNTRNKLILFLNCLIFIIF